MAGVGLGTGVWPARLAAAERGCAVCVSACALTLLTLAHVLIGKPVPTFPGHAPDCNKGERDRDDQAKKHARPKRRNETPPTGFATDRRRGWRSAVKMGKHPNGRQA